jgi:uncharacterized protein with HEPN domain
MSREAYFADEKTIDAVERCLQRISEAAYRLGPYLDDIYPDAPWKEARGIGESPTFFDTNMTKLPRI